MSSPKPTSAMRGITRREKVETSLIYPDGYRYSWSIQQQWSDGSWRDIPAVNEWDLPADPLYKDRKGV